MKLSSEHQNPLMLQRPPFSDVACSTPNRQVSQGLFSVMGVGRTRAFLKESVKLLNAPQREAIWRLSWTWVPERKFEQLDYNISLINDNLRANTRVLHKNVCKHNFSLKNPHNWKMYCLKETSSKWDYNIPQLTTNCANDRILTPKGVFWPQKACKSSLNADNWQACYHGKALNRI